MCLQFHQTEAEIAQEWVAFKSSKPGTQMSFTTLEKFEKEVEIHLFQNFIFMLVVIGNIDLIKKHFKQHSLGKKNYWHMHMGNISHGLFEV